MKAQLFQTSFLRVTKSVSFLLFLGLIPITHVLAKNCWTNEFVKKSLMDLVEFAPEASLPPPCVLIPPGPMFMGTSPGQCGAIVTFSVYGSPDCGPVTVTPPSGSFFPAGVNTVTATSGSSTVTFTIFVFDIEPPTVTCPADIVVNLEPDECETTVNYAVTATDNCTAGPVVQTTGYPSGSILPPGTFTNCFETTDQSGNTGNCCFNVTVNPNPSPDPTPDCTITGNTIICPGESTQLCAPPGYASYFWNTGETTSCITVNSGGNYWVEVVNAGGCYNTCNVIVTAPTQPDTDGDGIPDVCDPTLSVCSSIDILITQIQASNISNGLKNALESKLNNAKSSYQNGNNTPAINKLNAFINQVLAQSGNGIPAVLANQWIASAQAIIDAIANGNTNCTTSQGIIVPIDSGGPSLVIEGVRFQLSPNPVSNTLKLEFTGKIPETGAVEILDIYGELLGKEDLTSGERMHQLSVTALPTGMYFVRVTDGGVPVWTEKVVKQ